MLGVDTKLLVRYIVRDDPRQTAMATRFIERLLARENPGFIGNIVLCELVWVLESVYG